MLVYHGDEDEVLYYELVKPGYDRNLKGLPNFRFSLIPGMGHSVVNDELSQSTAWILDNLKKN
jgi:predicted esterase